MADDTPPLTEAELAGMVEYWTSPTGVTQAPPGMVEYARFCVDRLIADLRASRAEVERLRYFMRQRYDTIDGEPVCLLDYYDRLNPENIDWRRAGPHEAGDPEPPVYRRLDASESP